MCLKGLILNNSSQSSMGTKRKNSMITTRCATFVERLTIISIRNQSTSTTGKNAPCLPHAGSVSKLLRSSAWTNILWRSAKTLISTRAVPIVNRSCSRKTIQVISAQDRNQLAQLNALCALWAYFLRVSQAGKSTSCRINVQAMPDCLYECLTLIYYRVVKWIKQKPGMV